MAKCPKCENETFVSEKLTSPFKMVIVKCQECETAVSSMEDMDLEAWRSYKNHQFFENQFNYLKKEVDDLKSDLKQKNMIIIDLLERLNNKIIIKYDKS